MTDTEEPTTGEPAPQNDADALYERLYGPRTTPELEPEAADIYEHFYKRTER